jgi:DNA-binding transcriptional ArsR family regulator
MELLFSERSVTQDLKRLKDLGLIEVCETVGKVIRYTTTPLGAEVVFKFIKINKRGY